MIGEIFFNFFTSRIGLTILKIGAIVGAVVLVLFGARQAGRNAERVEQLEQSHKALRKSHEVDVGVDRMRDGAAADELRRDWSR